MKLTLVALIVAALLLPSCASPLPREEVRAFLDTTYQADPERSDTWLSPDPVPQTADAIAARVDPRDRFQEQQADFMRAREYAIAVFPADQGARIEFDRYDNIYHRHTNFVGGFWGRTPTSYGPRGERASRVGGGFRGGGPGFGK